MNKYYGNLNSKCEVLKALTDQKVMLILTNGLRITASVNAVKHNILYASIGNRIMIIDISCICAISTCCEEILESVLNNMRKSMLCDEEESSKNKKELFLEDGNIKNDEIFPEYDDKLDEHDVDYK